MQLWNLFSKFDGYVKISTWIYLIFGVLSMLSLITMLGFVLEKVKLLSKIDCYNYRRKENHELVKFDFLGYSFQPRTAKLKKTGRLFLGYDCAINISSRKWIADKLEEL